MFFQMCGLHTYGMLINEWPAPQTTMLDFIIFEGCCALLMQFNGLKETPVFFRSKHWKHPGPQWRWKTLQESCSQWGLASEGSRGGRPDCWRRGRQWRGVLPGFCTTLKWRAIIKVNILQGQLQGKGGSGVSSKQEVAVARAALNGLLATPLDQVEQPWD